MTGEPIMAPAPRPCGSCPYRRDVPSGVWAEEEYVKLPEYDLPTGEQPPSVFLCHQQDGRACAGWVGVHDMDDALGFRFAASLGLLDEETMEAMRSYKTDVPLFDSGLEACSHGMKDVPSPSEKAIRMVARLERRLGS